MKEKALLICKSMIQYIQTIINEENYYGFDSIKR
jgi:hypothetical protein